MLFLFHLKIMYLFVYIFVHVNFMMDGYTSKEEPTDMAIVAFFSCYSSFYRQEILSSTTRFPNNMIWYSS